ncbi:MAG: aminotransferase class III-fold pyridoxal phosphate-dependent enzyme [Actinomycetes bacterium]
MPAAAWDPADLPERANAVLARGVTSFARSRTVPIVFDGARGGRIHSVDGRSLVDLVCGLGPILLGHGRPEVLDAVHREIAKGVLYGSHPNEILLGERITGLLPFADKIVMANSGSEAVHAALRIAKATTNRRIIIKFEGHYHGWLDPIFVNSSGCLPAEDGSGQVEIQHAVAGMLPTEDVIVLRWGDLEGLKTVLAQDGSDVAAVIMEPIPLNFGAFYPEAGYLEAVRNLCSQVGALLVFDEVLTGFRVALGGASQLLGIKPDIAVYAKAIASGFPLAVVAGSEMAMESVVHGAVHPAGTYSGSPTAVAAALATLDVLEELNPGIYTYLDGLGKKLQAGLHAIGIDHRLPLVVHQVGSILQILFAPRAPARSYADVARTNKVAVATLCEGAIHGGVYAAPRGLLLLNLDHTADDIDLVLDAFAASAIQLSNSYPTSLSESFG